MRSLATFAFLIVFLLGHASTGHAIVFIVNKDNPVEKISQQALRDYYYKRQREWPNGISVRFIESAARSSTRKEFVSKYLNSTPNDVDLHWVGEKLYSGDSAPIQESSDAMIISFVSAFKGAIGYVADEAAAKTKSVKVIQVEP